MTNEIIGKYFLVIEDEYGLTGDAFGPQDLEDTGIPIYHKDHPDDPEIAWEEIKKVGFIDDKGSFYIPKGTCFKVLTWQFNDSMGEVEILNTNLCMYTAIDDFDNEDFNPDCTYGIVSRELKQPLEIAVAEANAGTD